MKMHTLTTDQDREVFPWSGGLSMDDLEDRRLVMLAYEAMAQAMPDSERSIMDDAASFARIRLTKRPLWSGQRVPFPWALWLDASDPTDCAVVAAGYRAMAKAAAGTYQAWHLARAWERAAARAWKVGNRSGGSTDAGDAARLEWETAQALVQERNPAHHHDHRSYAERYPFDWETDPDSY